MKFLSTTVFLLAIALQFCSAQQVLPQEGSRKGTFYAYWGWDVSWYTHSDISFSGTNYDFKLENVIAKDRQSKFSFDRYFNPSQITIPQFNFRAGYFVKDNYELSLGLDHMKYVVQQDQVVRITGEIAETETAFNGVYANDTIGIREGFLNLEHTDGLNYINVGFRRFDELFNWHPIKIGITEGLSVGALLPRTNATLFNNNRHDEFHLAGYGGNLVVGLNILFWDHFFIQSELKGGFIHMPDVRTTAFKEDRASQHFFFSQLNIVFGARFRFNNK